MALINCPECGKEVSDKAGNCPNCGCPITPVNVEVKQNNVVEPVTNTGASPKKKVNPILFVIIGVVVVVAIIIAVVVSGNLKKSKTYDEAQSLVEKGKYEQAIEKFESIAGYKDADEMKTKVETYEEAMEYLTSGKYTEANTSLQDIKGFADVDTIIEQIKWETRTFECIKSLKEYLKNPDSLQLYEVKFYEPKEGDIGDKIKELAKNEPIVIMHEGAQNGFGGNTTGYGMFVFTDDGSYQYLGNCDTLDEDEVDSDDKDICQIINSVIDNSEEVGEINIDRVKQILKDENYTSVKIIN